MHRTVGAVAALSMFLFPGLARAQEGLAISLKAELRESTSSGKALAFVYVTGDALYPDGTCLTVILRSPVGAQAIKTVPCGVEHGRFIAEIGPWEEHFPAGRYPVFAEFNFDAQAPAVQKALGSTRDLERCLITDPEWEHSYASENPEQLARLKAYIARTGRCPGKTEYGGTELVVGSQSDAAQARAVEDTKLQDFSDEAARLLAQLAPIAVDPPPADAAAQLAAWRAELAELEAGARTILAGNICRFRPVAWEALANALTNLSWCADATEKVALGPGAKFRAVIHELSAKSDAADRDDLRALARARNGLAALDTLRLSHARAVASSVADAVYGPAGLKPAPARAKDREREIMDAFQQ